MITAASVALRSLGSVSPVLRQRVLDWLRAQDSVDIDATRFSLLVGADVVDGQRIADALAQAGVFARTQAVECPHDECRTRLGVDSLQDNRCHRCGVDLIAHPPRTVVYYTITRDRSRDSGWLVAVHGIRTYGQWQQELQWLVDGQYRRTVPFLNWKYGHTTVGAVVPRLQRRIVAQFLTKLASAQGKLAGVLGEGPPPPPDVVAHSFGTWIVAHALETDHHLKLGHVVLLGSIVRCDWDWPAVFERGQVDAILNYCAGHDIWVRIAKPMIPDAGPSGYRGFTSHHQRLLNLLRPGATHSSAFADAELETVWRQVMRPFFADRWDDIDQKTHRLL